MCLEARNSAGTHRRTVSFSNLFFFLLSIANLDFKFKPQTFSDLFKFDAELYYNEWKFKKGSIPFDGEYYYFSLL